MAQYVGATFRWPETKSTTKGTKVTKIAWPRYWVLFVSLAVSLLAATPAEAQPAGRATRPQVVPPQGQVRKVIFARCVTCHGIDDYAYSALDRAGWDAHITARHQGLNVTLPPEERALLLDWLAERFGPTTKPFPRTYVAREVTSFLSDGDAEALVKRACTTCHGVDRVNSARFSPDRWRVVTLDMRERGAKLEDQELERLVEWLGRTKGTNDSDRQ
jgi:mono/diheme cytochrome c family protein